MVSRCPRNSSENRATRWICHRRRFHKGARCVGSVEVAALECRGRRDRIGDRAPQALEDAWMSSAITLAIGLAAATVRLVGRTNQRQPWPSSSDTGPRYSRTRAGGASGRDPRPPARGAGCGPKAGRPRPPRGSQTGRAFPGRSESAPAMRQGDLFGAGRGVRAGGKCGAAGAVLSIRA